jgi:hypothetical protein
MAVREIAASYEAVCDCCKAVEIMASKGRPKYWCDLHILRDAYDFQGCAVADGSVKLLLCLKCGEAATKAMNAVFDDVRARAASDTGEEGE